MPNESIGTIETNDLIAASQPLLLDRVIAFLDSRETRTLPADEELAHIQADGFWGEEVGFHDLFEHRS